MEEERTIKQLLELMLKTQHLFSTGLCHWADSICRDKLITWNEEILLRRHIRLNRPNKFSSLEVYKLRESHYYWNCGNIKPRLKWIKKQIQKQ